MADAHPIQTNFTSGEVSPQMRGRVDVSRYQNGAAALENFIVRPQGGITRRSGFRFSNESRDSNTRSRILTFEQSDEAAYAILVGKSYAWIFRNGLPVLEHTLGLNRTNALSAVNNNGGHYQLVLTMNGQTIASVANNGAGKDRITTTTPNNYRTGSQVKISGTGIPHLDGNTFTATYISPTVFDLTSGFTAGAAAGTAESCLVRPSEYVEVDGSASFPGINGSFRVKSVDAFDRFTLANTSYVGPLGGALGRAYPWIAEIVTPYVEADLDDLYTAQSADVMYVVHRSYAPRKIQRLSHTDWNIVTVSFTDGPYLPEQNVSFRSFTNAADGTRQPNVFLKVTSYVHTARVKASANFANPGDNGKYIEYRERDQWRLALVNTVNPGGLGNDVADVTIIENVLLFLDEATKLTASSKAERTKYAAGGQNDTAAVPKAGVKSRVDPNNNVADAGGGAAGTLTAQFANTFGTPDIGKYIRYQNTAQPPASFWALIDGTIGSTGKTVHHAAAVTMASNNATGLFALSLETRTATITAWNGGMRIANDTVSLFSTGDVGRMIRLGYAGRWIWGKITSSAGGVNSYTCGVQFFEDFPRDPHNAQNLAGNPDPSTTPGTLNQSITFQWRLGAWSDLGTNDSNYPAIHGAGWPSVVCFHEQRLIFFRTDYQPQSFWMSQSGDFENFAPTELDSTVLDTSAITHTIVSGKVSPIKWASSGAVLLMGSLGSEWQARAASSVQEPITPTNISVTPQTEFGSIQTVRPFRIGSATLFVNRSGQKVREMTYNYELDAYVSKDVTILAEHILKKYQRPKFSEYQKDPLSVYWLVMNDGTLTAMTHERDQEVIAWHRHQVAGVSAGAAVVESIGVVAGLVSTLPLPYVDSDVVYVVVNRTINNVTRRYVEVMEGMFEPQVVGDKWKMFFVDSGINIIVGSAKATFNGLDYLEGETLAVLADGVELGDEVVSGGAVTIDVVATNVILGLRYTSKVKTLPAEAGALLGTAKGKTKRVNRLGLAVVDSLTVKHCSDDVSYISEILGDGTNFYTGEKTVSLVQAYNLEGSYYLKEDRVRPLTLLALMPELKTEEEQ